ncbi:hypothetical protein MPL3356_60530 [Mesorhizobium plurifarium]|uniref:Helix-turn-helix type 11 domain-containing protein n=1 Tax=Mesorhizobium plurifarium TaxID=69974 RepID=A0A090G6X5_MESPL|nr:hypothetical protein MPL3356_60530 [Mesorhizobium plurifarium]
MTIASLRVARAEQLLTELGDKVITADELAAKFGICARTIYRYIRELRAAGYPIMSEAGIGYMLRRKETKEKEPMTPTESMMSAFHEELARHIIHGEDAYRSAVKAALGSLGDDAEASLLTRVDLMDSDYARDVMHIKAAATNELRSFAESFHFTVTDSFYNDCYLSVHEPDSVHIRLGNQSDMSKHISKLEERRKAALASCDVMKIEPVKSRSLTEDEALLYQEITELLVRLRGPIFGTPATERAVTTERAADVIEKLQTALLTIADQKLSSEMDGREYVSFEEGYDSIIELARAALSSLNEAASTGVAPPLELTEIHIRLLKRGSTSKWIGLSDNAGIHDGEVCALGELERAGLVRTTEDKLPPGPPSMKPYEITDAGRAALAKSEG